MGKVFSLESYREEAEKQYGSYTLRLDEETVTVLRNPLRMNDQDQERVFELLTSIAPEEKKSEEGDEQWNEVGADDPETEDLAVEDIAKMKRVIMEVLELVGDSKTSILLDVVREDFAILMSVFQDYMKEVGLGEASSSPNN